MKLSGLPFEKRGDAEENIVYMNEGLNTTGLDNEQEVKFTQAQKRFADAYANSSIKDLPSSFLLATASYAGLKTDDLKAQKKIIGDADRLIAINVKDNFDTLIEALNQVTADLEANNAQLPSLQHQSVLHRVGNQQWHIHFATLEKIRKHQNGEQRFNELNEDMPMVADASGNNALVKGLQDDQWYFYGQGYAFRGHWQPLSSAQQDYKGQGMEFGLLKALQNGWAFGGMFGYQKVKMEMLDAKTDASVYRAGPFVSWSNDRITLDSMLTYGWVTMDSRYKQWAGSPKGSEWAAHLQGTYTIPLDAWAMGLKLVPEAYVGYRAGNIEGHDMKSEDQTRRIAASKQTGMTTRLGTGLNYTFADLSSPTEMGVKVGLEKTFMWQEDDKIHNTGHWPKAPAAESRDTAVYYGLSFNRQFGANLDKLIGLDYIGTKGDKSGSDALTLTYRQQF